MKIPDRVKDKLQRLPDKPGVYFMRDARGKIIYVGKAASLRSRVRSYFRQATLRSASPKLRGLVRSIADLDILVARTEAEATLTEGRMIKDYRPRYNVQFRDDKRFLLLRIDPREAFPRLDAVRLDKGDGATYFGPYASSQAARAALEFADKHFGLRRCRPAVPGPEDHRHCLNDIVRYCAAPCIAKVSREEYAERVERACAFLRGESPEVLKELEEAMAREAADHHFEKAAALRDTLLLLRRAVRERARVRKTPAVRAEDARAGVAALRGVLGLGRDPATIEACDISNISGTHAVGSLVCAVDGIPQKSRYRMFRIRTVAGSDDPRMMAEVIRRRFERAVAEKSPLPDLLLVDGGIAQLRAARAELDRLGLSALPIAGLAKRFEEIVWEPAGSGPRTARLPPGSPALTVLQRLRDEAHRFALTYHLALRRRRIRESVLDDIGGVGGKRKELLLRRFGSMARLRKATEDEIAAVPGVGRAMARRVREGLDRPGAGGPP